MTKFVILNFFLIILTTNNENNPDLSINRRITEQNKEGIQLITNLSIFHLENRNLKKDLVIDSNYIKEIEGKCSVLPAWIEECEDLAKLTKLKVGDKHITIEEKLLSVHILQNTTLLLAFFHKMNAFLNKYHIMNLEFEKIKKVILNYEKAINQIKLENPSNIEIVHFIQIELDQIPGIYTEFNKKVEVFFKQSYIIYDDILKEHISKLSTMNITFDRVNSRHKKSISQEHLLEAIDKLNFEKILEIIKKGIACYNIIRSHQAKNEGSQTTLYETLKESPQIKSNQFFSNLNKIFDEKTNLINKFNSMDTGDKYAEFKAKLSIFAQDEILPEDE